jgi:hypothetical protein
MNICFGNSSESQRMVDVSNDVIDIRERIEKIREAVENNPVGQTGTETIIPVSNTVELDSIVTENQRQLKADVNTQMLQSSSTEMLSSVDDSTSKKQQSSYPSIKLDISNQSRNIGLYLMLGIQILTNMILIFLLYRMSL